jgi:hypothetical protein
MFLDGCGVQQAEIIHILLKGPRTADEILEGGSKGGGGRTGAIKKLLKRGRLRRIVGEDEEVYYMLNTG